MLNQFNGTKSKLVGPVFFSLRKNSHNRIIRVTSWSACVYNFSFIYPVKIIDDL